LAQLLDDGAATSRWRSYLKDRSLVSGPLNVNEPALRMRQ
jgi:hypothetical protein